MFGKPIHRTVQGTLMSHPIEQISDALAQFRAMLHDRAGSTMVWFAVTAPMVLGAAGLGIDATLWYMDKRIIQSASDAAVIAGAHVLAQGGTEFETNKVVETEIARNDFAKAADDVITVNMPPKSGPSAGVAGFVEVIIAKQRPLYFARFFRDAPTVIQSRAVSGQRPVTTEHCVLALDRDAASAIKFGGTANSQINCGVGANSRSDQAIDISGGALVDVDILEAHGDIDINNNATLISDLPPKPYSDYISDPYADLEIPAPSECEKEELLIMDGNSTNMGPGRYCGGLWITNGSSIDFEPGVYIIDGGDFVVDGNSTVFGDGVTFILTADDPANIGTVTFAGGTIGELTAQSDDGNPYAGVLFYQDPLAPTYFQEKVKGQWVDAPIKNKFLGGATIELKGALYFPSQKVQFTGGATAGDGCMQVIARTVDFLGNANVVNDEEECDDLRVKKIAVMRVALVE